MQRELARQNDELARLQYHDGSQYGDTVEEAVTQADTDLLIEQETQAQEAEQSRMAARQEAIEASFSFESRDEAWAGPAAALLHNAMDKVETDANMQLIGIDCRSELCRVEVEFGEGNGQSEAEMQLALAAGTTLPSMTAYSEPSSDGWVTTVFFLARDGDGLSAFE